jgi:hypothetical protein
MADPLEHPPEFGQAEDQSVINEYLLTAIIKLVSIVHGSIGDAGAFAHYDSQAESVSTTNVNTGNDHDADSVDSDEEEDESTHAELSATACRRRGRRPRTSLTSTQGELANEGSAKRHKSTGEKMTEAILVLADADKTLAGTSAARQAGDRVCKLSRSDVAIKEFKEHC